MPSSVAISQQPPSSCLYFYSSYCTPAISSWAVVRPPLGSVGAPNITITGSFLMGLALGVYEVRKCESVKAGPKMQKGEWNGMRFVITLCVRLRLRLSV